MKIAYRDVRFQRKSLERIEKANEIIEDYRARDLDLTLRQIYYQFVARGWLANTENNYKSLGKTLKDGRECGLIDWWSIVDRTRSQRSLATWTSPDEIIRGTAYSYREDKWADQPVRLEAWLEKDALSGVIDGICTRHQIAYFPCRGYPSVTHIHRAADRFKRYNEDGQKVVLIYLGDLDPEGVDIDANLEKKMHLYGVEDLDIRRVALSMEQVRRYDPPPQPAKPSSSRYEDYVSRYGNEAWELDALDPEVMSNLIESEILREIDQDRWNLSLAAEEENKTDLRALEERWPEVSAWLRNGSQ